MPKGHWRCMRNITPRKVVFLTVNIFAVYVPKKLMFAWKVWLSICFYQIKSNFGGKKALNKLASSLIVNHFRRIPKEKKVCSKVILYNLLLWLAIENMHIWTGKIESYLSLFKSTWIGTQNNFAKYTIHLWTLNSPTDSN